MSANAQRYTAVAIVLHWAIAIAIAGMIPLGWWMGEALENRETQAQAIAAFQLHKSIGLSVLVLSVARLAWRIANPPPPLPEGMKPWERLAAIATHWAFYFIIIAMPLTGWLYVSTGWSAHDDRPLEVPTLYFGLFQVPHLLGLTHQAEQTRAALAALFENFHSKMAWGAVGLTALHVAAALKHHFVDKDDVLARMLPGLKALGAAAAGTPTRKLALAAGFMAIALAAAAALWAFTHPPTSAAPPAPVASTQDGGAAPAPTIVTRNETEHAEERPAAPAAAGAPPAWRVARGASVIAYSGVHAGIAFEGRFSEWRAEIRFDPANLDQSSALVTIQTGSAADGVPLHDQSLPGQEWFDVADHPTATFRTTSIRAQGDAYEARGALTIKDHPVDIRLPFTLSIQGDRAVMDGTARISRRDADLGMASDPDAEYVSAEIAIRVHVEATRAP